MPDFAQHRPLLSDDYGFLALTLYPDQGMDVYTAAFTPKMLHFHTQAVGQLSGQLAEQFLADAFGHQEAFTAIGDLVFREKRFTNRQQRLHAGLQLIHIVALARRQRYHVGEQAFA